MREAGSAPFSGTDLHRILSDCFNTVIDLKSIHAGATHPKK